MTVDYLIIGSGIAGLSLAIRLSEFGTVLIVSKKEVWESNTNYAQGGIASVIDKTDSIDAHVADTMIAGDDLCNEDAVRLMVEEGPKGLDDLISWGVAFTKQDDGELDLAMEGGHSYRRIAHAKDATGKEIERALIEKVKASDRISVLADHMAVDLITEHTLGQDTSERITCFGAYILNRKNKKIFKAIASYTVLCTGGCGEVYLHTTNPSIATADGVSMAYRAGCRVENMEFMQFHPTSLYEGDQKQSDRSFLITEAVRGFGATLRNHKNEAFMKHYDDRLELAPRDIVARAIDEEMKKNDLDFVYLDLTHKAADEIKDHFPTIYRKCKLLNIDITKDLIPVVPSAHYMCGGIKVNLDGETELDGLMACGEVSSTGIHGANRLASNSLLEALVYTVRIAKHIEKHQRESIDETKIPDWDDSGTFDIDEWTIIRHDRMEVKRIMWDFVGIVRSDFRLNRALQRINLMLSEIEVFYRKSKVIPELIELRNITHTAQLIVRSALQRKESRGLHYTIDYPDKSDSFKTNTVLRSTRFLGKYSHA